MHGIGGNRSNWRTQLPAFAEQFSCVAWDARGYGAPVSVLPRAGHVSNIENAPAFNRAALDWLAGRGGLGATPTRNFSVDR